MGLAGKKKKERDIHNHNNNAVTCKKIYCCRFCERTPIIISEQIRIFFSANLLVGR